MKKNGLIITIGLLTISLAAIAWINKPNNEPSTCCIASNNSNQINDSGMPKYQFQAFSSNQFYMNQNMNYQINGNYTHPVTQKQLLSAQSVADIIPQFPFNWIKNYNYVKVNSVDSLQNFNENGIDHHLNANQKKALINLTHSSTCQIIVGYTTENSITHKLEDKELKYSFTVVPETQAKSNLTPRELSQYFQKELGTDLKPYELEKGRVVISFVVNNTGNISDQEVTLSSGNAEIDKNITKALIHLPTWTPAKDSNGNAVSQKFIFTAGNIGC